MLCTSMVTIQTIENIKLGSKITLYNGIYAILTGLFYILCYNWIMRENFRAVKSVWQVFYKYNPDISSLFFQLFFLKGLLIIALGIFIIYLSIFINKKKEKSTWVILFITGVIFWAGLLITEVLSRNIYTILLSFFGWFSFVIGQLIPIKYYVHKVYDSY